MSQWPGIALDRLRQAATSKKVLIEFSKSVVKESGDAKDSNSLV